MKQHTSWRFVHTGRRSPAANMAVDEAIAIAHREGRVPPTVRFYGWEPATLSIGYFQRAEREVDFAALERHGIGFVRRATGGRAVLHDKELTYSLVVAEDYPGMPASVTEAYRVLSMGLLYGFHRLGLNASMEGIRAEAGIAIDRNPAFVSEADSAVRTGTSQAPVEEIGGDPTEIAAATSIAASAPCACAEQNAKVLTGALSSACFDAPSRYELVVEGKKIAGSAQLRSKGVILQHGSVLLELDTEQLFDLLRFKDPETKARWKEAFVHKAIAINDVLRSKGLPTVQLPLVEEAFRAGFAEALQTELALEPLTPYEEELALQLAMEKYGTADWNLKR